MVRKYYVLNEVFLETRFQANIKTEIFLKNSKPRLNFGISPSVAVETVDTVISDYKVFCYRNKATL